MVDQAPIPTVEICGEHYPVPPITARQQRVIVPAIMKLTPHLRRFAQAPKNDKGEIEPDAVIDLLASMDEQTYGLILDTVYWGIHKSTPNLTREQFEDLPMSPGELMAAFWVVIAQVKLRPATAEVQRPAAE